MNIVISKGSAALTNPLAWLPDRGKLIYIVTVAVAEFIFMPLKIPTSRCSAGVALAT